MSLPRTFLRSQGSTGSLVNAPEQYRQCQKTGDGDEQNAGDPGKNLQV